MVNVLADAWFAKYLADDIDNKPHAIPGRRFRLSSVAHRCDRQLWFGMTRTTKSNPPGVASAWRMGLGAMVHEKLGDVVATLGNGWRSEIVVDLRSIGIDGSGSIDLVRFVDKERVGPMLNEPMRLYDERRVIDSGTAGAPDEVSHVEHRYCTPNAGKITKWLREGEWDPEVEKPVAVTELKTLNGFGFKMSATNFKGPAEGPKYPHVLQGALAGLVLEVTDLLVGYLAMECLSPDMAKTFCEHEWGRFAAEWHFSIPALKGLLDAEIMRINRVMTMAEANVLPARELHAPEYPPGTVVDDPAHRGRWSLRIGGEITQTGTTWFCDYCDWRDECIARGVGDAPVESDPF